MDEILIRSKKNVRETGEVFTPFHIVDKMLDLLPDSCWSDPSHCFLEPACGNGQFLVRMFERRVAAGIGIEQALNTMVGMDISFRNILDSHFRLYERACAQMAVEGVERQSDLWFSRALNIIAIATHNIFIVDDTIEYIKAGKLDARPFLFEDPTGNGQVMPEKQRRKILDRIEVQFSKYRKLSEGDATGSSFSPFFFKADLT